MKMKMIITAFVLCSLGANAQGNDLPANGENERPLGWHFYEDPEPEPETEPEEKVPPPPQAAAKKLETIEINSDWLRDNMPKLLNAAIDNPSSENIANYYYAQRLALDKASEFSSKTKEFFMFEETLSESNRRPNESVALKAHKFATNANKDKSFHALFKKAGLWMFYRSDCPYCHKQFPAMEALAKIMDVDVLAISMDGILLDKQFPGVKHVADPNMELSRRFDIKITPTTMLVSNDGKIFQTIKYGMASGSELVQRALYAAKRINLISDEEFRKTQEVREISIAEQPIVIDKEKLESDPSLLSDILRQRLESTSLATTSEAY